MVAWPPWSVYFSTFGNDTITDFVVESDSISFLSAGFGSMAAGPLANNRLVNGSAPVANQPLAQFLYASGTGQLSFDPDGNGALAPVMIAALLGAPTLSASDLSIWA